MTDGTPPCAGTTGSRVPERYAQLDLDGDAVIVYDRERTHAWIQSDLTVTTADSADPDPALRRERRLAAANARRSIDGGDADSTDG